MGYTALEAGVRLLPMAITMLIVAPSSARLVERFGTKRVVGSGLAIAGVGLALFAQLPAQQHLVLGRRRLAHGHHGARHGPHDGPRDRIDHGLVAARQGRHRFGDERHDPPSRRRVRCRDHRLRDVVGLRVQGRRRVRAPTASRASPSPSRRTASGQALEVASRAPSNVAAELAAGAREAFVYGLHRGVLVGAAAAFLGAIIAFRWLPAQGGAGTGPRNVHGTPGSVRAREGARRMTDAVGRRRAGSRASRAARAASTPTARSSRPRSRSTAGTGSRG